MLTFITKTLRHFLNTSRYLIVSGLAISCILFNVEAKAEDSSVVLVASAESTINTVSILDIRRLYLGIPPENNLDINKPVLNLADASLYNDFIKNIMHMTEEGYRRKIVKRVFLRGNDYIQEISNLDELVSYLNKNKNDISFIKRSDLKASYNLKVIAVLW